MHHDNSPPDSDQFMEQRAKELEELKEFKRQLRLQKRDTRLLLNKEGNLLFNQYWYTYW